jgi:hypothetical protein
MRLFWNAIAKASFWKSRKPGFSPDSRESLRERALAKRREFSVSFVKSVAPDMVPRTAHEFVRVIRSKHAQAK